MAAPPRYTLKVYRDGSHSAGNDVITAADGQTVLYHLIPNETSPGRRTLRKATADGPELATILFPTVTTSAEVNFPTGWSTKVEAGGYYTKKWLFKGFDGQEYSWRNVGTSLAASSLECWAEKANARVMTYSTPIYDRIAAASATIELDTSLASQIDLFVATGIAMEELDKLTNKPKWSYQPAPVEAKPSSPPAAGVEPTASTSQPSASPSPSPSQPAASPSRPVEHPKAKEVRMQEPKREEEAPAPAYEANPGPQDQLSPMRRLMKKVSVKKK